MLGWSAALPQRHVSAERQLAFIFKHAVCKCSCTGSSTCRSVSSFPLPPPPLSLPDGGVSIPSSYTSYLAPLSSSKLYNEVRGCRERDKDPECHFETPYVVRLHNFHQLAEPKACFTFTHPSAGAAGIGSGRRGLVASAC